MQPELERLSCLLHLASRPGYGVVWPLQGGQFRAWDGLGLGCDHGEPFGWVGP
jgi:hypothetical protein